MRWTFHLCWWQMNLSFALLCPFKGYFTHVYCHYLNCSSFWSEEINYFRNKQSPERKCYYYNIRIGFFHTFWKGRGNNHLKLKEPSEHVCGPHFVLKEAEICILKEQRETEVTTGVSFQVTFKKAIFSLLDSMIII